MNLKYFLSLLILGLFLVTACKEDANTEEEAEVAVDSAAVESNPDAPAPTEVTNDDLILFMNIMNALKPEGEAAQQEMAAAVTAEDMTVEQYMAIEQAKMNPDAEISEEDLMKFEKAAVKVQRIQAANKEKMEKMIEERGMSAQKYQIILNTVETNPSMRDLIQMMVEQENAKKQEK